MPLLSKPCERCGTDFSFRKYRAPTARFCSRSCLASWRGTLPANRGPRPRMIGNKLRAGLKPSNGFAAGHRPWNKNAKGIHLSPASEFKPGPRPDKRSPIGTVSLRRAHDGHLRAYVKVQHPNKWKLCAVKVWEDANGPVPKGSVVHHDDRNPLNDDLLNLICLTRAEHLAEHRDERGRLRASSLDASP